MGEDIKALHAAMDVRSGGPCADCHDDMATNPPQGCGRCHALPNEADDPARIGLKGAYHRQCIGCHERQLKPASAPTELQLLPSSLDAGPLAAGHFWRTTPAPQDGDPGLPGLPSRRWVRTSWAPPTGTGRDISRRWQGTSTATTSA